MQLANRSWFESKLAPKGVRYLYRGMTYGEWMESQELMAAHQEATKDKPEAVRERLPKAVVDHALRCGLLDWEGYEDDKGKPLAFSPILINQICYAHAMELSTQIALRSQLGADMEKNLSSQSPSRPSASTTTAKPARGAAIATKRTRQKRRATSH